MPRPARGGGARGHRLSAIGGITYRHYAHRAPLAFKEIMTLPEPTAFPALVRGYDGECPCCRRLFTDVGQPGDVTDAQPGQRNACPQLLMAP